MDTCWRLVICVVLVAIFPLAIVTQYIGPEDTTVLLNGTAILNCSFTALDGAGITQWLKDGTAIANEKGIFNSVTYPDSEVIVSPTPPTTRLDLVLRNGQVAYEGSYECQVTDRGQASAELKVEIQGELSTIVQTPNILTEEIQTELTCTASGYRPAVKLLWFRGANRIQTGIMETTEAEKADGTIDTMSVWQFTPTNDYNEDTIGCRTDDNNRSAPSQSKTVVLNVRFAPVVKVVYSKETIVCSADSNPFATSYQIILNKTQVVKEENTNGGSYPFTPVSCTYISCNMTNTIGTGVGEVDGNSICPGYVDPTATPSMTTDKNKEPDPTPKPGRKGLAPGIVAAIVVCSVGAVALIVVVIVICYFKKLCCFGSNKTKNETSPPKKQPSSINADMIRNQPEVRQSVHKYEDEPKKPRVARAGTSDPGSKDAGNKDAGKRQPSPQLGRQNVPLKAGNDHRQGHPKDMQDGNPQPGGMNYADLEFQDRGRNGNGHSRPVNPPPEEPTQYASILV